MDSTCSQGIREDRIAFKMLTGKRPIVRPKLLWNIFIDLTKIGVSLRN